MKNKLLILFCLVIGWASVLGQQIMHVPQSDKLPVQSVARIFQDSEGYIWYGTGMDYVVTTAIIFEYFVQTCIIVL